MRRYPTWMQFGETERDDLPAGSQAAAYWRRFMLQRNRPGLARSSHTNDGDGRLSENYRLSEHRVCIPYTQSREVQHESRNPLNSLGFPELAQKLHPTTGRQIGTGEKEMHRLTTVGLATVGFWLLSAPVMAGAVTQMPEPGTLGLLAAGVAAVVIVSRLRKRK